MKRLIIALAMAASFGASAASCRVVTVENFVSVDAKGSHIQEVEKNHNRVFYIENGKLWVADMYATGKTFSLDSTASLIGDYQDGAANYNDGSHNENFNFDTKHQTYLEVANFIPDDVQRKQFKMTDEAQAIKGSYKKCSLDVLVKMNDSVEAGRKIWGNQ